MAQTGRIMRFDHDRGYGFVQPDDGGPDLFMHISELVRGTDPNDITQGTPVSFEQADNGRGPKAVRVRLLAAAGEPKQSGEPAQPTEREWRRLWDEVGEAAFSRLMEQARARGWVQNLAV